MEYISPIIKKKNNNETHRQLKNELKVKTRSRSDKKHPAKFPVDISLGGKLKFFRIISNQILTKKGKAELKQTEFNTLLLRFGLARLDLVKWNRKYKDTKNYMTTKLFQIEYENQIGGAHGLGIRKGISERKAIYLVIHSVVDWLERGGKIEEII